MEIDVETGYKHINPEFMPRAHQSQCWKTLDEDTPGIILLSGTGSGKTEAILLPSLFKKKRLVMIYPQRSLVEDQIRRIRKYVMAYLANTDSENRKTTIILDIGDKEYSIQYSKFTKPYIEWLIHSLRWRVDTNRVNEVKLQYDQDREDIIKDNILNELRKRLDDLLMSPKNLAVFVQQGPTTRVKIQSTEQKGKFLAVRSKKHYYGGEIILTTLDKFLYRFFGYGERKWNLLYPYRLYMGQQSTKNLIVCFDEAHTYDTTSYTNFVNLISTLIANDIKTVVMSATLPEEFVKMGTTKLELSQITGKDYKGEKIYHLLDITDEERNKKIKEIVSKNLGKKCIIVRNTVRNAYNIFKELLNEGNEGLNTEIYLYHGRQFSYYRTNTYEKLKKLDEAETNKSYVLVTTHAIEVGCDLDSEVMITDYCNPDQLIQRAGRCARKKETAGHLYILGKDFISNQDSFLKDEEGFNYEEYLKILEKNTKKPLPEDAIRTNCINHPMRKEELTDALFQYLYSYVYEFDRTREELYSSGLVITRSWIPSAKFFWVDKDYDITKIAEMSKNRSISEILHDLEQQGKQTGKRPLRYFEPLNISLSYFGGNKINSRELKGNVLVLATQDTENAYSYTSASINAHLNNIYIFYKPDKYPNLNPSHGLIQVPKVLEKTTSGLRTFLTIKKQFTHPNVKYDQRIWYLDPKQVEAEIS